MNVNVLGAVYTIEYLTKDKDPALKHADGYCDSSAKCIVVRDYTEEEKKEPLTLRNLDAYKKKVLRHELAHACLYESGMTSCSNGTDAWAINEEMVDWIAVQGPKLYEMWKAANAL